MNSPIKRNSEVRDYRICSLSKKETAKCFVLGFFVGSAILFLFYHNILCLIGGVPCGLIYIRWQRAELAQKRRDALESGFKDWISAASANLQAGYSVENAFLKGGQEMALLYPEDSDIRWEVRNLENHLKSNITLERALKDLGQRSGSEDVNSFADVFAAGKRSGGDLRSMIENCCEIISMRIDVEREIKTLIHGKVMEQKIMCVVPFAIIFYISLTSPGYFDSLYNNVAGALIMTAVLAVYAAAVKISLQIIRIRV